MRNMSSAMLIATKFFHTIILVILIQLFVINVVSSGNSSHVDNPTDHSSTGRSKRSLFEDMPAKINIQIEYSTGESIELSLSRQFQYLANRHLPVLTSSGYMDPNIMNNVGEFIVYHDLQKCSSVVYFLKTKTLFGYIATSHFIVNLPFKYDESTKYYPEVVRAPYVIKRSDAPIHLPIPFLSVELNENSIESFSDKSVRVTKRPFQSNSEDSDEGPSTKHLRINREVNDENDTEMIIANASDIGNIRKRRGKSVTTVYYLETLIFVTRGIVEMFQQSPEGDNYMEEIVKYCIIYFNAVDMTLKNLRLGASYLHMNIAKIIIEDEVEPFIFITNGQFQFSDTVGKLRDELKNSRHIYTEDSFDHIFVITSDRIADGSNVASVMTHYGSDLYDARRRDQFYTSVPITTISHKTDYVDAVHTISRTFGITIDPPVQGLEDYEQCSSIMQNRNSKCDKCLKWSATSARQFRVFFSGNRDRCFLINEPRSLRPPGPTKFMSPNSQCQCFGYDSYVHMSNKRPKGYVQSKMCNKPLRCGKVIGDEWHYEETLKPFDGSVCGNRRRVCWGGECVLFESEPCMSAK